MECDIISIMLFYCAHVVMQAPHIFSLTLSYFSNCVHPVVQEHHSLPLGIAAEKGHTETVKALLEGGANINDQDKVT